METKPQDLMTIGEMAVEFGVNVQTMSGLVRGCRLTPKKVPRCPRGKGFDSADVAVIRDILGFDREPALAASA